MTVLGYSRIAYLSLRRFPIFLPTRAGCRSSRDQPILDKGDSEQLVLSIKVLSYLWGKDSTMRRNQRLT
jgi:hypothetical protein